MLSRPVRRSVARGCALLALAVAPLATAVGPADAAPLATLDTTPATSIDVVALVGTDRHLYVGLAGQDDYRDLGGASYEAPLLIAGEQSSWFLRIGRNSVPYVRSFERGWARLAPDGVTCTKPSAAVDGDTLTVGCRGANGHLWTGRTTVVGDALPYLDRWVDRGGQVVHGGVAGVPRDGVFRYEVVGGDHVSYRKTTGQPGFAAVTGAPPCYGPLTQDDISGGGRACAKRDGTLVVSANDPADANGLASVALTAAGRPGLARDEDGTTRYYALDGAGALWTAGQSATGVVSRPRTVAAPTAMYGVSAASLGASPEAAQALGQQLYG